MSPRPALTVCAAMNGFMMVAGGVLVSISVMPSWLQVRHMSVWKPKQASVFARTSLPAVYLIGVVAEVISRI